MIVIPGAAGGPQTVVIVGVQRGGTSMVAGVCRELGIDMGRNLGNNHEDPRFLTRDLSDLRGLIETRNSEADLWGWKMPHSSEYLAELLGDIRNPFVIVVFRNLLSIARSQMKRSNADFATAFKFSKNRLSQVADMVGGISAPMMGVNYEEAVADPGKFVDEVCAFLHFEATEENRNNAVEMIDPAAGYQRTKKERWSYEVVAPSDAPEMKPIDVRRRNLGVAAIDGKLRALKGNGHIQFTPMDQEECYLSLIRMAAPASVSLALDVGNGFSQNMRESVPLATGKNFIRLKAGHIRGVAVYPSFEDGVSNVVSLTLHEPST